MQRRREFRQKTASAPRRVRSAEQHRGSSSARGYGSQWQRYRKRFLDEYSFCIVCITTKADVVDHIIPIIQEGELSGADDPLFWKPWNHEPLCRQHHAEKTTSHDTRLSGSRVWMLNRLVEQETDAIRNELIRLSEMWEQWVDLGTGQIQSLDWRFSGHSGFSG